jgi:hypothetical protein
MFLVKKDIILVNAVILINWTFWKAMNFYSVH